MKERFARCRYRQTVNNNFDLFFFFRFETNITLEPCTRISFIEYSALVLYFVLNEKWQKKKKKKKNKNYIKLILFYCRSSAIKPTGKWHVIYSLSLSFLPLFICHLFHVNKWAISKKTFFLSFQSLECRHSCGV